MKKLLFFLLLPFLIVIFIVGLIFWFFTKKTAVMDLAFDIAEYLYGLF